jgi:hypothetical protein
MTSSFRMCCGVLATIAMAAGQPIAANFTSVSLSRPGTFAPRRLRPGASVCVNPPLNLTGLEIEAGKAARELAERIRQVGFAAAPLGTLKTCDATLYTEIVSIAGRSRKNAALDFRILLLGEEIPRLCSSLLGKPASAWHDALIEAFAQEARRIWDAQEKGMEVYDGAVE